MPKQASGTRNIGVEAKADFGWLAEAIRILRRTKRELDDNQAVEHHPLPELLWALGALQVENIDRLRKLPDSIGISDDRLLDALHRIQNTLDEMNDRQETDFWDRR